MTTTGLDREVAQRLGERAVRYTPGRRAVVRTLERSDGPMSATEIHGATDGGLPLSSIYRSLTVLERAGVLAPHHGARGLTRYELAEWLRGHHHHLVCVDCGSVEDVGVEPRHEAQVENLVVELASPSAFTPTNHVLEIEGRCAACS